MYTTLAELTRKFGLALLTRLTDRAEVATGALDQSVIDQAILDTGAVIDGYLARRYVLPLDQIPDLLGDLALAIAIYKLHIYAPDPKIEADYKDAMRALREIGEGKISLPVSEGTLKSTGTGGAQVTDRKRPLTAQNMTGFI